MRITVGYLLSQEFFKDFKVIAGKKGLNREFQGVSVLEAPDGPKWILGKEILFTSGYVISKEKDCIDNLKSSLAKSHAALVIKRGRYLDTIPTELIDLYEENDIPLITMPYSISWMEITNQVNIVMMNHSIQQLCVNFKGSNNKTDNAYREQRVQRILQIAESEMGFPAAVYDVFEGGMYYSSNKFLQASKEYGLKNADYLTPSVAYTSTTLCDYIHMVRYRLINDESSDDPRVSWIKIPIIVDDVLMAYFFVMESKRFLDFYDEYFVRLAYMLFLSIYEQILVARDISNIGFENLINMVLENKEDYTKLSEQAKQFSVSIDNSYICILFSHDHHTYDIRSHRNKIIDIFHQCAISRYGKFAFISGEEVIILVGKKELSSFNQNSITSLITEYKQKLEKVTEGIEWKFSFTNDDKELFLLKDSVDKCRKIMKIGKVVFPKESIFDYDHLGILTWLDIPEYELKELLEQFEELIRNEKNKELLQTLSIYLENNMNYSVTADKLFVNINTVRRRIEKINELVQIDWDDYLERIKVGLMLKFLRE